MSGVTSESCVSQGLECSPKHWPCLHQIITVSYALGNYEGQQQPINASDFVTCLISLLSGEVAGKSSFGCVTINRLDGSMIALAACLVYVARALQRDPGYMKGLAFLHNILTEQKGLLIDVKRTFSEW